MHKIKVSGCILLLCTLLLGACEQSPVKTESMLFREQASKDAQPFVKKAANLLTPEVLNNPKQNLDTLIIVKNALKDARTVYLRKKIQNWNDPQLVDMQTQLDELYPGLASHSIELLYLAVARTTKLRDKVEIIRTQPIGMSDNGLGNMLDSLIKEYSDDMDACCLVALARIDELLIGKKGHYQTLNKLLRQLNVKLQKMFEEKAYAQELRTEIANIEAVLKRDNT